MNHLGLRLLILPLFDLFSEFFFLVLCSDFEAKEFVRRPEALHISVQGLESHLNLRLVSSEGGHYVDETSLHSLV